STYLNNKDKRVKNEPTQLTSNLHPPSSSVKVENSNPSMIGIGRKRRTRFELRGSTYIEIFLHSESCTKYRYSLFLWGKNEFENQSKILEEAIPGAVLKCQMLKKGDNGGVREGFLEEELCKMENVVEKIAQYPTHNNKTCKALYKQEETIGDNMKPSKITQ
uniref:Uncharacterized protein n=1 Tax=Sus scrofa TaxID=9823 RepID=A0A8D1E877_PIG